MPGVFAAGDVKDKVFRQAVEAMASQGLRVLAFARLEKPGAQKITFGDITNLTLLGLQRR